MSAWVVLLQAVCHLAGGKALPDELVELVLVAGEALFDLVGRKGGHSRPDGLVAVLRVGAGAEDAGFFRAGISPPAAADVVGSVS